MLPPVTSARDLGITVTSKSLSIRTHSWHRLESPQVACLSYSPQFRFTRHKHACAYVHIQESL